MEEPVGHGVLLEPLHGVHWEVADGGEEVVSLQYLVEHDAVDAAAQADPDEE